MSTRIQQQRQGYYEKHKEKRKAEMKEYNAKARYGITRAEYDQLFIDTPMCELCKVRPSQVLDHDHDTKEIRGVLCHSCNTGIGKLGDTVEGLEAAIRYIKGEEV